MATTKRPKRERPQVPSDLFLDTMRRVLSIPPDEAADIVKRTSLRGLPSRRSGKGAAKKTPAR